MLHINSIKIYGFKASNRFAKANFSDENVSVIFGKNGCGKTSFLKVLYGVLSQDESVLIQNSVEKVIIEVSENDELYEVSVSKNTDGEYDWKEILDSSLADTSSLSLGVDRGTTNQTINADPVFLLEFFRHPRRRRYLTSEVPAIRICEELSSYVMQSSRLRRGRSKSTIDFDKQHLYLQSIKINNIEEILTERYRIARFVASRKIQSALFDTLAIAISIDEKHSEQKELPLDFESRLRDNNIRIREALDDGFENKFKDEVLKTLDAVTNSNGMDKIRSNPILSQLFLNIIEELEMEKLKLSSINLLVDKFNHYLIDDKELIVNSHEVYIKAGSNIHKINDLSSGERHILTFLSLVLFVGDSRNFLIIDEPEISLNIGWQRELLGLFQKLVPDTQIIVASHSPSLANDNPNYLTELVVGIH